MMQSQIWVPVVCLPVSLTPYRVNRHTVESGTLRLSYRPDLIPASGRYFFALKTGKKKPGKPGIKK